MASAGTDDAAQMRISSSGSIQTHVAAALERLKNADVPSIVLHNLPAEPEASSSRSTATPDAVEKACATSLHRLVSIVEIIKREYTKSVHEEVHKGSTERVMDGKEATGAKTKGAKRKRDVMTKLPPGLHQYNRATTLEELGLLPEPSSDEIKLQMIREGKPPRRKHTPVLFVTLSKILIDGEERKPNSCYQAPPQPKRYKTRRGKKRKKAGEVEAEPHDEEEAQRSINPDETQD